MSATRSKPPAPEDSREHQRIKSSLVDELARVLKTLQKNNVDKDEPIISDDSANAVCNVLEAVFLHGLKATYASSGWSLFGSKTDAAHAHFWPFLQKFTHKGVVSQLDELRQIKTDIGKCRAWVRLAINDGLIENYLDAMLSDIALIRQFYINHAFLRDIEKPEILKFYLKGLGEFMFQLSYNSTMLNMWPTQTLFLSGLWAVAEAPAASVSASVSEGHSSSDVPVETAVQALMDDVTPLEVSMTTMRKHRHSVDPYDVPFGNRGPSSTRVHDSRDSTRPSHDSRDSTRPSHDSRDRLAPPKLDFRPIAVTPPSQFHLDGFMTSRPGLPVNDVTSNGASVTIETISRKPRHWSRDVTMDTSLESSTSTNASDNPSVQPRSDVVTSMDDYVSGQLTSLEKEVTSSGGESIRDELDHALNLNLPMRGEAEIIPPMETVSNTLHNFYTIPPSKMAAVFRTSVDTGSPVLSPTSEMTEGGGMTSEVSTSLPSQRRRNSNRRDSEHLIPDFSHLRSDRRTVSSESSSALATSESPHGEQGPKAVEAMRNAMTQKFRPENFEDVTCGLEADDMDSDSWKGNNLNSMSGWSSNFNEKKEGLDEGRDVTNCDIAVVRSDVNTHVSASDFENMHSRFSPDASRERLHENDHVSNDSPSHSSSHEDDDFEVIPPYSPSYGQDRDKVKLLLEVLGQLCSERGLDVQNFQCHGCQKPIGIIYGKFRACTYDGYYYCLDCHCDDEYYIPSRILHSWDFAKHKVCKENKCFLIQVQEEPILDVEKINPRIYDHCDEMKELEMLRRQLKYLKAYLFTCKQSVADELRRMVWPREHLYDSLHLYSLSDLIQAHTGHLHMTLQKVVTFAQKHVYACLLCSQKGFYCEICKSSKVIFPFEMDTTIQCDRCNTVFHRACKKEQTACPRCQRRSVRRVYSGSSVHTPDATDLNFNPDFEE